MTPFLDVRGSEMGHMTKTFMKLSVFYYMFLSVFPRILSFPQAYNSPSLVSQYDGINKNITRDYRKTLFYKITLILNIAEQP